MLTQLEIATILKDLQKVRAKKFGLLKRKSL
jgi:hypothetical protein